MQTTLAFLVMTSFFWASYSVVCCIQPRPPLHSRRRALMSLWLALAVLVLFSLSLTTHVSPPVQQADEALLNAYSFTG